MPASRYVTESPASSLSDGGKQYRDPTPFELEWEEVAPRRLEERFRIYCRSNEGALTLIATCETEAAVGVTICTLGREGEFDDCALGILDVFGEKGRRWIIRPWEASPKNASAAGKLLRSRRGK